MRTAVTDGLLLASPCKVVGGGTEHAAGRPVASLAEVHALTAAMPERLRLVVLLATWCQLRRGELLGLRRRDVDTLHENLTIEGSRTFTRKGRSVVKGSKSAAGRRTLAIPPNVLVPIQDHLERLTSPSPDAFVFTGKTGVLRTAASCTRLGKKLELQSEEPTSTSTIFATVGSPSRLQPARPPRS
jgi:integrase